MHPNEQPTPYEAPQVEDVPVSTGTVETAPGTSTIPVSPIIK